jgi:hypothetical protein
MIKSYNVNIKFDIEPTGNIYITRSAHYMTIIRSGFLLPKFLGMCKWTGEIDSSVYTLCELRDKYYTHIAAMAQRSE